MRLWIFLLLLPAVVLAQTPAEPEQMAEISQPDLPPGEVFQVRDSSMIEDSAAIVSAVNRLIMAVTHTSSRADAWRSLVKPTDRVGLKVSAAGGETFSTHRAIVNAVVEGLGEAGVPATSIIVFDRDSGDLRAAGFIEKPGGYRVRSPYPGKGYAAKKIYTSMILGKLIWGDLDFTRRKTAFELSPLDKANDNLSSNSHFARIITEDVTKIINLPMLSAHASCGVAGALYNMTIPNVDNWRRFVSDYGNTDPAIPEIYSDPEISGKVVLHIMDGIIGQFAGGPEAQPNYSVRHLTLYASRDPVALDTVALEHIDEWRVMAKMKPNASDASYLKSAREYGLGNAGGGGAKSVP